MCGVSHSGKTTYAKKNYKDYRYVNSDEIREEMFGSRELSKNENAVWNEFSKRKFKALGDRKSVVLDACHISKQSRWHSLRNVPNDYYKILVVMKPKTRTIIERVLKEQRIDTEHIYSMLNSFVEPTKFDGFDEIITIK